MVKLQLDLMVSKVFSNLSNSMTLSAVLINRGGLRRQETACVHKRDTHVQEGLERRSGNLQACQPDLGVGNVMEQIILRVGPDPRGQPRDRE